MEPPPLAEGRDQFPGSEQGTTADQGRTGGQAGTTEALGNRDISVANVYKLLQETKKSIVLELRKHYDDLDTRLDEFTLEIIKKTQENQSTRALSEALSRSRGSEVRSSKRRRSPGPEDCLHLDVLLEKDMVPYLIQWTMLVTVEAFVRATSSSLRVSPLIDWVTEEARAMLASHASLMDAQSGLSVLYFSVEPGQKWTRFHGSVGKLWSYIVRQALTSALCTVRTEDFDTSSTPRSDRRGRIVPDWLASFGDRKATQRHVFEVFQCVETTDAIAKTIQDAEFLSRRKRMRTAAITPVDEHEVVRDYSVKSARTSILNKLTYGRLEARKHLCGMVMFLVEIIREDYGNRLQDAANAGYEVAFEPPATAAENSVPLFIEDTIWDIEEIGTEDNDEAYNDALLQGLARKFPSLHVTLKYPPKVLGWNETLYIETGVPEYEPKVLPVSLHEVALTVLTASMQGKSNKEVLKASGLALRTIHVLAVGIKGHLKKSLGLTPSEVEEKALGGLQFDDVIQDDGNVATTKAGKRNPSGHIAANSTQAFRNKKLNMTLMDWHAEKEADRARMRGPRVGQSLAVGVVPLEAANLDEGWLKCVKRRGS